MAPDSTATLGHFPDISTQPKHQIPDEPQLQQKHKHLEEPSIACSSYTMIRQIGTGGYGKVYLAQHKITKKHVAIKVMSQSRISRFLDLNGQRVPAEIALMANLSHASIIRYIAHFKVSGGWCLVMEYPPGYIDLFEMICERGRLNELQTRRIIQQVLLAVNHCLLNQVDHRDIKDENLLVDPKTLHVKLIDFGSASQLTEKAYTRFQGTDVYLPPEWYTRHSYMALPATSWAIGCLIFTCLSGDSPFATREEVKRTRIPWEKLPSGLSDECYNLLKRCLNTSARHRISLQDITQHSWLLAQ